MKKFIACAAIAATASFGLALTAVPASATTLDSFGICVPSEDTTTTVVHPAVGEPTLVVTNPDYVAATPGTPGTPAVGEPTIKVPNPAYIPAVPGTPGVPAIGEPEIEVPNPDYVAAVPAVPGTPAVGEPTIVIDNPDYVAPTYTPGYYQDVPAVGTPTIIVTKPNPAYVPAVAEIPEVSHTDYVAKRYVIDQHAQPAVTKTQWRYVKNGGYGEVWLDSNAEQKVKINGHWYERTSKTRTVEVTPAQPEKGHWEQQSFHEHPGAGWTILSESKHVTQAYVPGTPAQGSETIDVEETNPDYVPATKVWVPPVYTPPVGPKTITVDNPAYIPATEEIPGTPAVGEPTIIIDNPAYVPAVPAVDEIPAVGEETITVPNPDYVAEIPGTPGTPAQGEPTIVIENPDYVPERIEIVVIPGVDCPVIPEEPEEPTVPEEPVTPEEPTVPEEPATPEEPVTPTEPVTPAAPVAQPAPAAPAVAANRAVKAAVASDQDTLAQTGGEGAFGLAAAAAGLLAAGGALTLRRRHRNS